MTKPEPARAAANVILENYERLIGRANVADSGEARIGACLTLTIFEQFRSALCLVDSGLASHAAGPIRSMLEGVADLMNLTANAEYLDQLRYENARANVALFNEISRLDNVPEDIAATLARWIAREEPIRKELRKAGFDKLAIEAKLSRADLGEAYVQYRILCSFVHTSITSMIARHAGRERMTELGYCRPADPPVVGMLLMIAVDLLVRAGSELHRFTDIGEGEANAVAEEAKRVWEKGQAEDGT
ncbi:DUF5677 domain-containing protein [Paraburkholderia flava]|uniref:DUF5677 domain-containing protein n=1 Tax=Paraburkholderia flava TaxID=2547393 RepID=UPI0010620F57|nr:DUF5677 domain-containing protein [Paraburkholderia flava]